MKKYNAKDIVKIAIVAALYIALTIFNPLSYSSIQFRISEVLVLLVFFNKKYAFSLVIGVFISNFFNGEFMLLDIFFGTISTLIACILITKTKSLLLASIYPVITSILVVIEIWIYSKLSFYLIALEVMGSMLVVLVVIGYPLFKLLSKNKKFLELMEIKEEEVTYEIQS